MRYNRAIIAAILTALMCIAMFGCSSADKSGDTESASSGVCYVTIDDYCTDKAINFDGGDSVYDVLVATGADVISSKSTYGMYVKGINGRFELDEGDQSGWIFTVNGESPVNGCDKIEVHNEDTIHWEYVTEYSE